MQPSPWRLLRRPVVKSYLGSLLGLGYDSERERSLSYTLVASTIFLTLASGYTTWLGLCEYLPGFVAFLLTLGIQGLLYGAAWRLGGSLNTRAFRTSLLVIYLVTMFTSVFFSYSALLDTVYRPKFRQRDQLNRARLEATALDADLSSRLDSEFRKSARQVREDVSAWHQQLAAATNAALVALSTKAKAASFEHQRLERRAQDEAQHGGTIAVIGGRTWMTPPGYGSYAHSYETEADTYYATRVEPTQERYRSLVELSDGINTLYQSILRSDAEVTPANLAELDSLRGQFEAALASDSASSGLHRSGRAFSNEVLAAAQAAADLHATRNEYAITGGTDAVGNVQALKQALLQRIQHLPALPTRSRDELLRKAGDIGELQGADVHQFALAVGELRRGNLLAVGAFMVALVIDGLILLCGVLAARPDSYLDMRNPDDLMDIQELAIETVMGVALSTVDPATIASPFVRRCLEILRRGEIDTDLAYSGFPVVLSATAVGELQLLEVGVLLALRLAERLPDGRLALRTRFVLWLADSIQKGLLHQRTFADFRETIDAEV